MQKTSLISDIQHELSSTRSRLETLESERKALENESMSANDRNSLLIRSLETQVTNLSEEVSNQRAKYEKRIEALIGDGKQKIEQLQVEYRCVEYKLVLN